MPHRQSHCAFEHKPTPELFALIQANLNSSDIDNAYNELHRRGYSDDDIALTLQ